MDCGSCTLCCKLLELHEIPSPIDTYCNQCEVGVGCKVQHSKPKECREFKCMWLQMDNASKELRPDKCHIIFSRTSEDVITGRLERNTLISPLVLSQIKAFNKEGFSVIVFRGFNKKFFLKDGHTESHVIEAVNDRSKLHRRFN